MQSFPTRSHALPPSRAPQSSPGSAAPSAAGGGAPQIEPAAAPAFFDAQALQAEWDRAGTLRRLRLVASTPALRRELLILPALLVLIGGTLPLLVAVLP